MYRFSLLIQCKKCGMSFKAKRERGKVKYVCSGYERYGKAFCGRHVIKEDELNDMIEFKFQRELSDKEIRCEIDRIYVMGKFYEIFYKDGSTQLVQPNLIKFL